MAGGRTSQFHEIDKGWRTADLSESDTQLAVLEVKANARVVRAVVIEQFVTLGPASSNS
jgi:hypothetical protein